jgi:hypothetical protein
MAVTWFAASAKTLPSLTMTVPNGPPRPERTLSSESWMARAIKRLALSMWVRSVIA